jgi:hypothetical protein
MTPSHKEVVTYEETDGSTPVTKSGNPGNPSGNPPMPAHPDTHWVLPEHTAADAEPVN